MLPFEHTWLPFVYLYILGGILFSIGIWVVFRSKSIDLTRPHHKRWLFILIFGMIWYMSMHALLNLAALDYIQPFMILVVLFIELVAFLFGIRLMHARAEGVK